MAISYPINTPTGIGIADITLMAENAVAVSQSPFTFKQQVVAHPGQRWAASVSLPPMRKEDAEPWVAFLLSLKGQVGTFLLSDPNCLTTRGSANPRNLFTYTEQFDNAAWTKQFATITPNTILAPDGLTTADTLVETTTTNFHYIFSFITCQAGVPYTLSVYAKAQSSRNIRLTLPSAVFGSNVYAVFNPTTGAIVASYNGVVAATEALPDGWFRFSITKVALASGSGSGALQLMSGTTNSYLGDGVSGVYIWGVQAEIGTSASAYQSVQSYNGPLVNGASQVGETLAIKNAPPSTVGYLLPGDYIQLGSATTSELYKVLTQVDTDASGNATLDIWPNLRSSPADGAAIVLNNTKGKFRLKENVTQWSINNLNSYGITFDCVEAL